MRNNGGAHRSKRGSLSKSRVAVAGGAGASALVLVIILSSWYNDVNSRESYSGQNMPTASGDNVDSQSVSTSAAESGGSSPSSSIPEAPGPESQPEAMPNENQSPGQLVFTDDNFELLRSDPAKYANSTAAISGKVYEVTDQSSGLLTMVAYRIHNRAIESDESRAAIMFQEVRRAGTLPSDVSLDGCISIQGTVRGGIGDYDSLGQSIRIPIIDAQSLNEIECIDSAMPATTTINSNLSQSYAGVILSVERVQLSDGHLRVKITAKNDEVGDSVYIREKESRAEHDGVSYQSLNHLPIFSLYKLDSTILAESEITGYLFFEPVPDYAGDPIVFKIVVEKVGISESEKSTFILKI